MKPFRPARDLPDGDLRGATVRVLAPCGKHTVAYPNALAGQAIRQGLVHCFPLICECGTAYIVHSERDGVHFRGEGSPEAVLEAYEKMTGEELFIKDDAGTFRYKRVMQSDLRV